jgi:hypothetical protein
MKKLGRRKRRYKKLQEAKLAAEQEKSDSSKPFGIDLEPVQDLGEFGSPHSENSKDKWRSPTGGILENSEPKDGDQFDQESKTAMFADKRNVNPMIDRYAIDDTPLEDRNINV